MFSLRSLSEEIEVRTIYFLIALLYKLIAQVTCVNIYIFTHKETSREEPKDKLIILDLYLISNLKQFCQQLAKNYKSKLIIMSPNGSTHILLFTLLLTLLQIPSFTQEFPFPFPEEETEFHAEEAEFQFREEGLVWPQYYCLGGDPNSYIAFENSVFQFGTHDFTVSIWVKTSEASSLFDIVGNRFSAGNGNFFQIRMTGSESVFLTGQVVVEIDEDHQGTNFADLYSARTELNDGNWHTITVVRDGTTLNLYIDGVLDSQRITGGVADIDSETGVKIGQSLDPSVSQAFAPNACYKDFRVYYRALSAEEITTFSVSNSP